MEAAFNRRLHWCLLCGMSEMESAVQCMSSQVEVNRMNVCIFEDTNDTQKKRCHQQPKKGSSAVPIEEPFEEPFLDPDRTLYTKGRTLYTKAL